MASVKRLEGESFADYKLRRASIAAKDKLNAKPKLIWKTSKLETLYGKVFVVPMWGQYIKAEHGKLLVN